MQSVYPIPNYSQNYDYMAMLRIEYTIRKDGVFLMLKFKLIEGTNAQELEKNVNDFVSAFDAELNSVQFDFIANKCAIFYDVQQNHICCECRYWDDSGSSENVSGLCQHHGGRRRFNCRACADYKDIRG